MKKVLKFLMSALFVLSVLVLGTSCQDAPAEDDMELIDINDFVIPAGMYDYKSITTGTISSDESVTIVEVSTLTASVEVKGTEPADEVIMTDGVLEVKMMQVYSDSLIYKFTKALFQSNEEDNSIYDDANKTISNIVMSDEMNYQTIQYAKFMDSMLSSEEKQNLIIFQNKDRTKTRIEFDRKVSINDLDNYDEIPTHAVVTITRK